MAGARFFQRIGEVVHMHDALETHIEIGGGGARRNHHLNDQLLGKHRLRPQPTVRLNILRTIRPADLFRKRRIVGDHLRAGRDLGKQQFGANAHRLRRFNHPHQQRPAVVQPRPHRTRTRRHLARAQRFGQQTEIADTAGTFFLREGVIRLRRRGRGQHHPGDLPGHWMLHRPRHRSRHLAPRHNRHTQQHRQPSIRNHVCPLSEPSWILYVINPANPPMSNLNK